ncbi:hypothetical protein [Sphingobium sp. B2]|uniref:hypothetical protein n=1 Tax=Sphingobium sp. B2 TaxID=2583228 RepID=UPI001643F871|nr:hypothetical protein [Sphingobium sp. B2]
MLIVGHGAEPVSYTHLDVYKRQLLNRRKGAAICWSSDMAQSDDAKRRMGQ